MMNGASKKMATIGFQPDSILPREDGHLNLKSASVNSKGRLEVNINSETLEFPGIFLRRSCQCKECWNSYCLSSTNSLKKVFKIEDLQLTSASASQEGVTCEFSDGHSCTFGVEWLYLRRLTPEGSALREEAIFIHKTQAWPMPDKMVVQKATWHEVTETEDGFDKFGSYLIRDGIFVITGAPTDRLLYEELGKKTGLYPEANHYGPTWIVENVPDPENHAYTPVELDLHVDQPFLNRCPNIQLLHCMKQSDIGGENVMCDGIKAALVLKERHPEYYNILTSTTIQQQDLVGHTDRQQFYLAARAPTIVVDDKGQPATIMLNHAAQASFFPGSADEYEKYSEALKVFFDIIYELSITLKSAPGDILVFDNERVMHGRLAFDARFPRKLEGWYLNWDFVHSRLRVSRIKKLLKENDP